MLGRRVGNPTASASDDGNHPSWEQEEGPDSPYGTDEQANNAFDYAQEDGQAAGLAGHYEDGIDEQAGEGEWEDAAQDENRALVPANDPQLPTNRGMAALSRLSGEPREMAVLEPRVTGAILVPGHGKARRPGALGHSLFSLRARRPRPFMLQVGIALVAVLAIATTAFAMAPLSTETQILNGFTSFAGFIAPPSSTEVSFHWYVVHYGDSLKSIADRFGVLQGGILELNGLHSADDLYVGMRLKIPTSATYGQDFQSVIDIPIPPPDQFGNRFGSDPWNSTAGTTDPQNVCAPQGNADNQADRQKFQLINPNPNSSFARGFTWYHNGVDLDNPPGTPILAAQAGLVLFGGWDIGGLGWSVKINNCWGLSTIYGHMMYPPKVHAGDYVQVGDQIGQEGSTGNSTGPHLHFMTEWFNQWANPYCFDFNLPAGNTPCTSP
jgi:LysM repeat protein